MTAITTRTTRRISAAELAFWSATIVTAFVLASWARSGVVPADESRQTDGKFLSDIDAPIAEMNIHFTPEMAELTTDTYADLFRGLDESVRVHVVVPDAAAFRQFRDRMEAAGVPALHRFEPLVMDRLISTWARDRYVARAGSPRGSLLVPAMPTDDSSAHRRGDWFVPWTLAKRHEDRYRLDEVPLRFDGGDFVATESTLFCDANLLAKNVPAVFPDRATLIAWLERASGLRVELIGNEAREIPDHHIGMVLSPLPDGRVIVADARPDNRPDPVATDATLRALGLPARHSEDFEARCDFMAQWLTDRGYDVVRVPIFATADEKVFVTWNNVLFETRHDGRWHVYLPVYDAPEFDDAARAVWEQAGAIVHPVRVRRIFVHRGSVRCLTQVLRRAE